METVVIYDLTSGVIRGALTITGTEEDSAKLIAANTPAGCGSLVVPIDHAAITNIKCWVVVNGVIQQVQKTAAQLLVAAQTAQSAIIEAAYQNATSVQPMPYMGTTFFTDAESKFMQLGAAWGYTHAGAVPDGFTWWDSKGNAVPMTLVQLQGLATATLAMVNDNFGKRKNLLAQIAAATTVDLVTAVVWVAPAQ